LIRIIGVQRSERADKEFVLLQNQGALRISLRGHLLLSECAVSDRDLSRCVHVFTDEVLVPAGMYILLGSGFGETRWTKSKDGSLIYHAYMERDFPVWDRCTMPLHLLNTQHSFADRRESALIMR
jgi:hypothetical protein